MNDDLKTRIHRVEGQVAGIGKMIKEDRDCLEVVQQIVATREALGSLGKEILKGEALCLHQEGSDPKRLERIEAEKTKLEKEKSCLIKILNFANSQSLPK